MPTGTDKILYLKFAFISALAINYGESFLVLHRNYYTHTYAQNMLILEHIIGQNIQFQYMTVLKEYLTKNGYATGPIT